MRKLLLCTPAVLFLWGCSGGDSGTGTQSKVATSVAISPGSINFDAIGATQVLHATVLDQGGSPMAGIPITWTAGSASILLTPLGGDSARVTTAANGNASVTATGGAASGSVSMTVAQVPTQLVKVDGTDGQVGTAGGTLPTPVRVKLVDRMGAGVAGKTVTFTVTGGGGTLSSATAVTEADGTAAVSWTLGGTPGAQAVTATFTTGTTTVFTATAVTTPIGVVSPATGGDEAAMVGGAVPTRPGIIVRNLAGQPVAGASVTFSVAAGNGTITGATTTTDATGLATVGSWTLGSAGPNKLTATVNTGGFSNNPVVFTDYGCQGGGGGGYAITLCFTTTMSATQRAAFENAAARWATVITGDLSNEPSDFVANDCGENTPRLKMNIDDLVIFAAISDIDGPGQILGQATPCYIRDAAPQLSLLGFMEFDAADMVKLEAQDQLGAVILHEMGHVLGVGTLWKLNNLLVDATPVGGASLDTYYSGAGGRAGFDAIGGLTYTGGQKVPVENSGGGGTVNSHWRETVLKNELMTGFLGSGSNPMSLLTVRSLADLGYTVNTAAADPFSLTLAIRGSKDGSASGTVQMRDDILDRPIYTIDRRGRRTRLPAR